jgi:hypothetical protein
LEPLIGLGGENAPDYPFTDKAVTYSQTACGNIGEQTVVKFMSSSWTKIVSNDKRRPLIK